MTSCHAVTEFLLEADLSRIQQSDAAEHLSSCPACGGLLVRISAQEDQLRREVASMATGVARRLDVDPSRSAAAMPGSRWKAPWRMTATLAAAVLGALLLMNAGEDGPAPFPGTPEWTLPDIGLQSTHPLVVSSETHAWVAVLPTDDPNLTLVWFAN